MPYPSLPLLCAWLCLTSTMHLETAEIVAWRLDGNGFFPPQRIATTWGGSEERNVVWATPLPNWSNSSPIVYGDKVFCMAEPTGWAPILLCVDAHTGKIAWQREVDHLAALPGGPAAAREFGAMSELIRTLIGLLCEHAWYDRHGVSTDDPRRKDLAARVARSQADYEVGDIAKGNMDVSSPLLDPYVGKQDEWLERYGLSNMRLTASRVGGRSKANAYLYHGYEDRNGGTTWVGTAWGTPLCDGERVYVCTGYNSAAAFTLDGKPVWTRFLGYPDKTRQKELSLGGWPKQLFVHSPIWADGKLITYMACVTTAFDPASGEVLWQTDVPRWTIHQNNDLHAMDIDGLTVIAHPAGKVLRASDGKVLVDDLGGVGKGGGNFMAHGDTIYHLGKATRLVRDGDSVRAEIVWQLEGKKSSLGDGHGTEGVIAGGRLYLSSEDVQIVDALTGRTLGRVGNVPSSGCSLAMTGSLIVTGRWRSGKGEAMENPVGRFGVVDVQAGTLVATNELRLAEPEGDKLRQIWRHGAIDGWRMFGAATPFIAHGRIYIRSFDHLFCIGTR